MDAPVEVIGHDLSSPYQFWCAAHALAEEGRIEDALGWLERGRAAHRGNPDARLAELAGDLHARAGRPRAATDIAWLQYTDRPSLGGYRRLHDFATAAGTWAERWDEALAVLRAQPTADAPRARPAWGDPPGHSALVEVLMWEDDIDTAQYGGCVISTSGRVRSGRQSPVPFQVRPAPAAPIRSPHRHIPVGGRRTDDLTRTASPAPYLII